MAETAVVEPVNAVEALFQPIQEKPKVPEEKMRDEFKPE